LKPAGLDSSLESSLVAPEPIAETLPEPQVAVDPDPLPTPTPSSRASSAWRVLWELLHDVSVAVLFCFFLVTFVAQAFRVQGTSMQPLLQDGERIVVNKLLYRFHPIERGDVVVFWYPRDPAVSFIKRVVGLPGDMLELRDGYLYVNGRVVEEPYLGGEGKQSFRDLSNLAPTEVKPGFYFVLGDHRGSSNDSRNWGEVPEKYIYGKAVLRFWPLSKSGRIH
jgi:signal peptidase I